MDMRKATLKLVLALTLIVPRFLSAGEIVQYFPADGQAADRLTQWRVEWGIERHVGGAEVLYIKNAWFSRAPGDREIRVLGDSRVAELFTPYNAGARIFDISDFPNELIDLGPEMLGPGCLREGRIFDRAGAPAEDGPVAAEVRSDHLRWMDPANQSRRGQELQVWSVMDAFNYRYILLYTFRDDGQIGFRVGATGNLLAGTVSDIATHLHTGCWRINVALDNQSSTIFKKVTHDTRAFKSVVELLNTEERFKWNPEEFTRLRIESTTLNNAHVPPSPVSYDLVPMASGAGRFHNPGEEFTQNDFWLTLDRPNQMRCPRLDRYENGQFINGGKTSVWYLASFNHTPRDEDFGRNGYVETQGVAIVVWAGFDLKPRNFFSSTPLYP